MTITTLGGTLIRLDKNKWQWSDGTPAPSARDDDASSLYNFRCRQHAGKTHVEVLLSVAHRDRDTLGWVLDGASAGKYKQDISHDHLGPLMITSDDEAERMHIEPGEDPLLGNEPIIRKRAIPRVALVPMTDWQDRMKNIVVGCLWPTSEDATILAKAMSLGWVDPRSEK